MPRSGGPRSASVRFAPHKRSFRNRQFCEFAFGCVAGFEPATPASRTRLSHRIAVKSRAFCPYSHSNILVRSCRSRGCSGVERRRLITRGLMMTFASLAAQLGLGGTWLCRLLFWQPPTCGWPITARFQDRGPLFQERTTSRRLRRAMPKMSDTKARSKCCRWPRP